MYIEILPENSATDLRTKYPFVFESDKRMSTDYIRFTVL